MRHYLIISGQFLQICYLLTVLILFSNQLSAQPPQLRQIDKVLASIDGQLITQSDLRYWLFQARTDYPEFRTLPDDRLIPYALEEAVREELLYLNLWSDELEPGEEEVKEFLEISFQKYVEEYQSEERLQEELRTWKLNLADLRRWLEARVRRDWVIESAITDQIPIRDYEEALVRAEETDDQYRLREIYIEVRPVAKGSGATEGDWIRTEHLMNSIRIDIAEGLSFADAAAVHSQSPSSDDGGELGWILESDLSEEIRNAVTGLSAGQTSRPVRLVDGIGLYKLDSKLTSLAILQREIRDSIRQKAVQESLQESEIQLSPGYSLANLVNP